MGEKREDTEALRDGMTKREIKDAVIRDTSGKYAIDHERHRIWFRASTGQLCDDGIVIEPEAWRENMPNFMEYGPFLNSHKYDDIERLLGIGVDYEIDKDGLLVQTEFAVDDAHPKGRAAWYLYSNGYGKAVSVGWKTLEGGTEKTDEQGEFYRVTKARLLELSAVALGMDDQALAKHNDPMLAVAVRTLTDVDGTRPGWEETENQYRYRIRDPKQFNEDTFKILKLDVKATGDVHVVRGKFKGSKDDGKMHAQAIRFQKDAGWTLKAAQSWWNDHKDELSRALDSHILTRLVAQDVVEMLYADKIVVPIREAVIVEPEPEPDWKAQLRELIELNKDLTSEDIRTRLDEIKHEIAA